MDVEKLTKLMKYKIKIKGLDSWGLSIIRYKTFDIPSKYSKHPLFWIDDNVNFLDIFDDFYIIVNYNIVENTMVKQKSKKDIIIECVNDLDLDQECINSILVTYATLYDNIKNLTANKQIEIIMQSTTLSAKAGVEAIREARRVMSDVISDGDRKLKRIQADRKKLKNKKK